MTRPQQAASVLEAMTGRRLPGGCDDCDANQTVRKQAEGLYTLTVHHDETGAERSYPQCLTYCSPRTRITQGAALIDRVPLLRRYARRLPGAALAQGRDVL